MCLKNEKKKLETGKRNTKSLGDFQEQKNSEGKM